MVPERAINLDKIFCQIIEDLIVAASGNAAKSAENTLQITKNYLSVESFSCITDFHQLYFSRSAAFEGKKEQINKNIDDLFEQVQKMLEKGVENVAASELEESEQAERERLGVSGLQKKLESIITLELGLREKLVPILNSMQFEDATRQRLEHVVFGLKAIEQLLQKPAGTSIEACLRGIAQRLSAMAETELYYELVLKEKPPAGLVDRGILLEF